MICNKCGATIPDDSLFCENCGAPLEAEGTVEEPVEEVYEESMDESVEEAYEEPVEEVYEEPVEETIDEVYEEPEEFYEEPMEAPDDELYEESEEAYEETEEPYGEATGEIYEEPVEEVYEESEYVAEEELNYEADEEPAEMPIEDVAESDEFNEIEELEAMEVVEEPEVYDEAEAIEDDEFREIDELESMDEVEYDEEEYSEEEYEDEEEEENYDREIDEDQAMVGELPEEAELPDLSDLEFEETGQPEGAETEWLESFQQLEPKAEDWEESVEEEYFEEPVEEELVEEEVIEEPADEEAFEEETFEETAVEESLPERVAEEPEFTEEPEEIEEPEFTEEPDEIEESEFTEEPEEIEESEFTEEPEEAVESEFTEEPEEIEEPEFTEEPEEIEESEFTEEPEEAVEPEFTEEPEEAVEPEFTEESEETEEPEFAEGPNEAEEPVSSDEPGSPEDSETPEGPDSGDKVGAWLGNLGKSVRTGTGWAVDIAKEKASKLKEEKKAEEKVEKKAEKKAEKKPEKVQKKIDRNQWTEEDEGELDLGYNFWYRSNQADTSSRYEGMEEEEEPETEGASKGAEKKTAEEPRKRSRIDDATTYVAVKSRPDGTEKADAEGEGPDGRKAPKKKANKLKITVIIMVIAAILGAGGIFGTKAYTENKQEEAYKTTLTKAEKSTEAKDYASAEKLYKGLIKEYPDRPELYEALAKVYIADEKFDDAKNTVNEGVARTGNSKAFETLLADIDALTSTDWQEPFRRVLADNEWAARSYEDENGSCVALCDITGDRKPEMLYFTQEYYGYGILHICVYENEKVSEVSYECKNRGTQYQDAFYDIEDDDSGYVVYKSKTDGNFGIYESVRRGSEAWQTINKYTLAGTDCERDEVIEACIETSYQVSDDDADDVSDNDYYKNEEKIKYSAYLNEFKAILDDIDKVIITSDNPAGDKEIWNRIMDMEEEAMTYDGAMKILDEDAQ